MGKYSTNEIPINSSSFGTAVLCIYYSTEPRKNWTRGCWCVDEGLESRHLASPLAGESRPSSVEESLYKAVQPPPLIEVLAILHSFGHPHVRHLLVAAVVLLLAAAVLESVNISW